MATGLTYDLFQIGGHHGHSSEVQAGLPYRAISPHVSHFAVTYLNSKGSITSLSACYRVGLGCHLKGTPSN